MDFKDGHFHIPATKKDVNKTAFSYSCGIFENLVTLFGLRNTLSIYQRVINQVLFDLLDSYLIVYLDSILVFSCTKEDYVHDLNAVFNKL